MMEQINFKLSEIIKRNDGKADELEEILLQHEILERLVMELNQVIGLFTLACILYYFIGIVSEVIL